MPHVEADDLRRFAADYLEALGVEPADAAFAADCVVGADLAGHESHGVRRLPEYLQRRRDGHLVPGARPVIEHDRGSVVRLDGCLALGHVALRDVVDLAVERARAHGVAVVALRHASHAGRLAEHCARAAAEGVVLQLFVTNSGGSQTTAPPGATVGRMSTNPIGVGVPRSAEPHLALDMATSVIAHGRLGELKDRAEHVPDGWLAPDGTLRHSGGYKGFGIALVAEALGGTLSGAGSVGPDPAGDDQGVLAIAIDVTWLRPLAGFAAELDGALDYICSAPLEPGAPPLRVPGESSHRTTAERLVAGVEVHDVVWERLAAAAAELGVPLPPTRA